MSKFTSAACPVLVGHIYRITEHGRLLDDSYEAVINWVEERERDWYFGITPTSDCAFLHGLFGTSKVSKPGFESEFGVTAIEYLGRDADDARCGDLPGQFHENQLLRAQLVTRHFY